MLRGVKWLISAALCTLLAAGWYFLPTFTVRAPRRYVVQIDTGGGPLEFDIVFWPNDRGTHWHPEIRQSGANGSFGAYPKHDPFSLARTVDYEPGDGVIEISFLNGESHLHLMGSAEDGFVGTWVVEGPEGAFTLPARAATESTSSSREPDPDDFLDFSGEYTLASSDRDPLVIHVYGKPWDTRFAAEIVKGLPVKDLMRGRIVDSELRLSYFDGRNAYLLLLAKDEAGTTKAQLWNGTWKHQELEPIAP